MNKHLILKGYFLLFALYSCEPATKKESGDEKVQPAPSAITETVSSAPTSYADTLFIQDDFATQPFSLDSVTVLTVQHLFDATQLHKKPIANKYSKQQIDTLVTIRKEHSYVQLYVVNAAESKCFYQSALIRDSLRVFSQPVQIGFTKEQVEQALFPSTKETSLPDVIQISNASETDLLYLVFGNNKLKMVQFQPYLE